MSSLIVIGELRDKDREEVRRVLVESYRQYESEYSDEEVWKDYMGLIASSVDNPDVDRILVAKSGEEVLGSLQFYQSSEKAYGKPELEIFSPIIRFLGVHPNARGKGIAQQLLKAGINYAKEQRADYVYLHSSDKMQKAVRLYKWFGFKRDPTRDFYAHNEHAKCYRLDIREWRK